MKMSLCLWFTLFLSACVLMVSAAANNNKKLRYRSQGAPSFDWRRARNGARTQRIRNKKRNRCPKAASSSSSLAAPFHLEGTLCRRNANLDPCTYDFVIVPTSDENGVCTGEATCQAQTQCSCVDKQWECVATNTDILVNMCQGDLLPDNALNECTPGLEIVMPEPEEPNEEEEDGADVQDVFVRDEEEEAVPTCPVDMPATGQACTGTGSLSCPYDYVNMPTYHPNDGSCLDEITCIPLASCDCGNDGVWECYSATIRRCRGDAPDNAFMTCTP